MDNNKRGPYSSPRQKQRRQDIMRAAVEQIEARGLSAVTMKDIAEASGVSTKTLYNLYGSRDLLLLEAASGILDALETSTQVQAAEPGIPRLLAYTERAMACFDMDGEFARFTISILLAGETDHPTVQHQLGLVQVLAEECLAEADARGEIVPGTSIEDVSRIIAANQWGVALLWEKGMMDLEQMKTHTLLSHLLTLASVTRGRRRKALEKESLDLQQRMSNPVSGDVVPISRGKRR